MNPVLDAILRHVYAHDVIWLVSDRVPTLVDESEDTHAFTSKAHLLAYVSPLIEARARTIVDPSRPELVVRMRATTRVHPYIVASDVSKRRFFLRNTLPMLLDMLLDTKSTLFITGHGYCSIRCTYTCDDMRVAARPIAMTLPCIVNAVIEHSPSSQYVWVVYDGSWRDRRYVIVASYRTVQPADDLLERERLCLIITFELNPTPLRSESLALIARVNPIDMRRST